ncbi:hypothetical protein LOK49_LG05G00624 [Camellia lanceoleosa]|uniref:Uncharacterized protein n=1 Tax=Camellia lanceoleosa TaxID=1840588 RepID=A0ACC0HNV5_9ERIC|nr:hypothetical protein LOK49_LG05G00624 [Camellia lanceoleosa]
MTLNQLRDQTVLFSSMQPLLALRIEPEEVGLMLLETIFLLVGLTGDIPTLADDALPELSVKEEDFGGGFVLVNVEELEEEASKIMQAYAESYRNHPNHVSLLMEPLYRELSQSFKRYY